MTTEDRWAEAWRQRDRLLRIARRRVPTYEDAEDIVAEVIQRAGAQHDLDVAAIPAWTTRVTVNLCIDRQRRLATQRALVQRAELRPDSVPSHEDDIASRAEALWVAAQIGTLPERQARALRLRAEGLDNSAIAARLGVTVATVEGLLKRSRAALRLALRAVGAVVVGVWSAAWGGRRTPALVTASAVLALSLLPWIGGPHDPVPTGPSSRPPAAAGAGAPAEARGVSSSEGPAAGPKARVGPSDRAHVDPRLGRADPYEGPRCLAAYCLPIVDEEADRSLGARYPQGWSPADLRNYLGEPAWRTDVAARRPLVAVVGMYDFPWVLDDLAVYRQTFNLPPCSTENGCLHHETAPRQTRYPEEPAWTGAYYASYVAAARNGQGLSDNPAVVQAQLLQGVSAACPECRIALVRATSEFVENVANALRAAQALRPDVIVGRLDVPESSDGTSDVVEDPSLYEGSVVALGAVRGGYEDEAIQLPRRLPVVINVGGTTVTRGGRVVTHDDNASYCNLAAAAPAWQAGADTGCPGRAGVDLTLPAGTDTGLAVYVSGGLVDDRGWYHPGRAAQAVAIFGGLFARHGLKKVVRGPADLYAHPEWFTDIVDGSTQCVTACSGPVTGTGCPTGVPQLCSARRGWDGPTGLGEARGLPWF